MTLLRLETSGVVPYKGKEIWLQERADNSKNGERVAFWGGALEPGEDSVAAAVREYKEELGLDLKDYDYLGTTSKSQPRRMIIEHTFMTPAPDINPHTHRVQEGKRIIVVTVDEARKLHMNPGDDMILDKIQAYLQSR